MRRMEQIKPVMFALGCALVVQPALAQQAPDAGTLLREQPRPATPPATPQKIEPATPATKPADEAGPKVLVKGFRIQGALLIAEAELQGQLEHLVGQELSLGQLHNVALYLAGYYFQKGYLARVLIPPQEIKDGVVEIRVIEGKLGSLSLDIQDPRLDSARIRAFIEARVVSGTPFDLAELGEALNILNEQPGVEAKSTIAPGKGEAVVDIALNARAKPLFGAFVGANNHGPRGTGKYQATGAIYLNNPSGHFDAASLLLNASEGSTYVRADYSIAVGDRGLRLGGNASYLDYEIVQSGLTALKPDGIARTYGLAASYPLARRNDWNLSLTGSYDDKRLIDRTTAGETSDRHVTVTNIGIGGYAMGGTVGDAVLSFGATVAFGHSDQKNAGARAADAATRQAQGSFSKLAYNLGYLRPLPKGWSLTASLRGQLADNNLDSSERMSLGGPTAVRAYPVSEASGDEALLISFNLGKKLNDDLKVSVFYDVGTVRLNKHTWANWNSLNPRLPNRYTLDGVGAGLDWRISPTALLTASLALPLGNNPGRDTNDRNIDGSSQHHLRGWLAINAQF